PLHRETGNNDLELGHLRHRGREADAPRPVAGARARADLELELVGPGRILRLRRDQLRLDHRGVAFHLAYGDLRAFAGNQAHDALVSAAARVGDVHEVRGLNVHERDHVAGELELDLGVLWVVGGYVDVLLRRPGPRGARAEAEGDLAGLT